MNQLFLPPGYTGPGSAPNLDNFRSPPAGTFKVVLAYYGFNSEGGVDTKGYFLDQSMINCRYHSDVLILLKAILERQSKIADADQQANFACSSSLRDFYRTTSAAFSDASPSAWSSSKDEKILTCTPTKSVDRAKRYGSFFSRLESTCTNQKHCISVRCQLFWQSIDLQC